MARPPLRELVRETGRPPGPVGRTACFKRTSAASSQRTIASSRKSSASATSASATSSSRGLRLDPRVALHDLDRVPAVHLQDLVDVGAGDLQRDQHLDHELVARRRDEVGRRAQPAGELFGAGGGDPVALLRPLAVRVGLDEPVALEALQRRVDLPDVQRPDLARPRLELALQPQAVLRPLAEQGEERVGDAHERLGERNIPSMYTRYSSPTARARVSRSAPAPLPAERVREPRANELAGALERVGGLGQERPEHVEDMRVRRV